MMLPGFRTPRCSASSIIARAMRSLIEPPGFCRSSLTQTSTRGSKSLLMRSSVVLPIVSRMLLALATGSPSGLGRFPLRGPLGSCWAWPLWPGRHSWLGVQYSQPPGTFRPLSRLVVVANICCLDDEVGRLEVVASLSDVDLAALVNDGIGRDAGGQPDVATDDAAAADDGLTAEDRGVGVDDEVRSEEDSSEL